MKTEILNIKLDNISHTEANEKLCEFMDKKTSSIISTVNAEFIVNAQNDSEFKSILNHRSSLNLIDGMGVVWADYFNRIPTPNIVVLKEIYIVLVAVISLILFPIISIIFRKKIANKISGIDFAWEISKMAAKKGWRLYLLGYKKGLDPASAEKASLKLQTNIYNLKIAGVSSGTESVVYEKEIIENIKKSAADILFICFGSPKQEKWLARNLSKTGCKIGIGLGGTLDFIADIQKRAPRWVQKIGFEWLYRIFQNPRRIKRLPSLFSFIFRVIVAKSKSKHESK